MSDNDTADMDKHTDDQLQEGLEKVAEQRPRLEQEGSEDALEAQETQAEAMARELAEREGGDGGPGEGGGVSA